MYCGLQRAIGQRSLLLLHATELEEELVRSTLNVLLKFEDDIESAESELKGILREGFRLPPAEREPQL